MNSRRHPTCLLLLILALTAAAFPARAQQRDSLQALKRLTLDQLMNIEVTSVSRRAERLAQTASAIQVITQEDILRSGASSLPEALRLAANLQVSQVDARQWAISARGFNSTTANKLLVLIDGRTVYTPLFSGVFWDAQDVSLSEILKSGLTMHEERASRGALTLGLEVLPEEIVLRADERKLRQVVFNLLSNAVKFTPPGGRVRVSAQVTDSVVQVAVADTGPGIDDDEQESIFEVFQQGRRGAVALRPEGSGLGLPLARRFVELHGGRLWVESTRGQGTTFRFTMPVSQDA